MVLPPQAGPSRTWPLRLAAIVAAAAARHYLCRVFPTGELVHDRYSYLPSLGAALIAALAFQPLCTGPAGLPHAPAPCRAAAGDCLPLSYSTANASSYWVNNLVLFEHAQPRGAPKFPRPQQLRRAAFAHRGAGHGSDDVAELVNERPGYFLANYNLGRVLYEMNLACGPPITTCSRPERRPAGRPEPICSWGYVCMKTGRRDEALSNFRRANALRPDDRNVHFALGRRVGRAGRLRAGAFGVLASACAEPRPHQGAGADGQVRRGCQAARRCVWGCPGLLRRPRSLDCGRFGPRLRR